MSVGCCPDTAGMLGLGLDLRGGGLCVCHGSIKCQKDDWPRHRETCERICFVSYDTVPSEDISRSPSPAG